MDADKAVFTEEAKNTERIPKYSIIPIRFSPTQEVGADEIVGSVNKISGKSYLTFIDTNGRMWKGAEEEFVVIRNLPTEEDFADFARLKKETAQLEQIIKNKKPEELDRAFH